MSGLRKAILLGAAGALFMATAGFVAVDRGLFAADHLDPPSRTDREVDSNPDVAADIADVYAWHSDSVVVIALTFAGPQPAERPPVYDRDVLYTINISNNEVEFDPEFRIRFRFGFNGQAVGVQFTGVPGSTGPIEGPVETNLVQGPVVVRAVLR